jgi:hypothetical protein
MQREEVLAKPESAMFWPSSNQQTEPKCGSLEDKLLRRTSPTVRELSLKRPQDRCLLSHQLKTSADLVLYYLEIPKNPIDSRSRVPTV